MSSGDSIAPLSAVNPQQAGETTRTSAATPASASSGWTASVATAVQSAQPPTNKPAMAPQNEGLRMLEGLILKSLVETMLPKETSELFGKGSAGRMWRSMLAEQIAQTMVEDGRIQLLPQQSTGGSLRADAATTPDAPLPARGEPK